MISMDPQTFRKSHLLGIQNDPPIDLEQLRSKLHSSWTIRGSIKESFAE